MCWLVGYSVIYQIVHIMKSWKLYTNEIKEEDEASLPKRRKMTPTSCRGEKSSPGNIQIKFIN